MKDIAIRLKDRLMNILNEKMENCEVYPYLDENLPSGDKAIIFVELAGCERKPENDIQLLVKTNIWIFIEALCRESADDELITLSREIEDLVLKSSKNDPELQKLLLLSPGLYTSYGKNAPYIDDLRPNRHHALIEVESTIPINN
jgi:hypothetical protein